MKIDQRTILTNSFKCLVGHFSIIKVQFSTVFITLYLVSYNQNSFDWVLDLVHVLNTKSEQFNFFKLKLWRTFVKLSLLTLSFVTLIRFDKWRQFIWYECSEEWKLNEWPPCNLLYWDSHFVTVDLMVKRNATKS